MKKSFYHTKSFLRRHRQIVIFTVGMMAVLLYTLSASAQELVWERTNGPYGGIIRALLATPDGILYAGTEGNGIFRSDNKGNSWNEVNKGLTNLRITSLAVMGMTLYAGTNGGGVFRSEDRDNTWTKVNMGLMNLSIGSLAVMDTTLFAGTFYGGIFSSDDGGNTWDNMGLNGILVFSLAVMGRTLYAGLHGSGIFRSEDKGETWNEVNTGLTNPHIRSLAVMGTTLYAGTNGGGIFRSEDGGKTWTAVNTGLTVSPLDVTSLVVMDTMIYAGTGWFWGVFRSDDKGNTWHKTGLTNTGVNSLIVMGTELYAGTQGDGVFRSDDKGKTWNEVNTGLNAIVVSSYVYVIFDKKLYMGSYGSGVFRSDDVGDSWIKINRKLENTNVTSLALIDTTLFAGTFGRGVYRSKDGGNTWILTGSPAFVNSLAIMGTTLFTGTNGGGVFRSEDKGYTWIEVNDGLKIPDHGYVSSFVVFGTTLYMNTSRGIFRFEGRSNTWTDVSNGLTNTVVHSLAVVDNTLYSGTLNGVFLSDDGGNSWVAANAGLENVDIRSLAVVEKTLYAGTYGSGIFRSDDGGNSWVAVNTRLTNPYIHSLVVMDNTLYAGTEGGIFRTSLAGIPDAITLSASTSIQVTPSVSTSTSIATPTPSQLFSTATEQEEIVSPYHASWALLIGINKYFHLPPQMRLNYAVNDVDALKQLLIEVFEFPPNNVITLKDEQATQKDILDQLSNLADTKRIGKDDRILVFFSGHGQTVPLPTGGEMGFLIPYDAQVDLSDVENPGQYYKSCIGMDELKRRSFAIPAKHVLFLVDSCYSGLAAESRGGLDPKTPGLLEKVSKLPVRHIITAGLRGEKAFERPEWGHGAFTYKLLEALRTGASDWNNDSVTTGEELAVYLRNVVPNIAPQTPHQGRFEGEGEFLFAHKREKRQKQQVESVSPLSSPVVSADSERPQIYLIEPSELRSTSRDLIIRPAVKSVKIVGIATDNIGVVKVLVDGRAISLTAAVERDLQLVSAPILPNYKTVRFETEIIVSDGKPRDVKIEAIDAAGNNDMLLLHLQFQTSEPIRTIIGKDGAEMVLIPAGEFLMGNPKGGNSDEHPQHTVYLDAFYIDKYEVTNAQYEKFMEATGHPAPNQWNNDIYKEPEQPVVGVGWFDYDKNYYRVSPKNNPKGPSSGTSRVLRGGAFTETAGEGIRAAYRSRNTPDLNHEDFGFRCAQDIP